MEGYEVIASDDNKVGEVVRTDGDLLIVESGRLRESRHAIPKAFAHAVEGEQVVRLSVSKELVDNSPPLDDDQVDHDAVAAYYGLAEGVEAPATQGYGDVLPDDPAYGAESDELSAGLEPAAEQRARMREGGETEYGPRGRQIIPPDSHDPL
jgi:hypothetical protein